MEGVHSGKKYQRCNGSWYCGQMLMSASDLFGESGNGGLAGLFWNTGHKKREFCC